MWENREKCLQWFIQGARLVYMTIQYVNTNSKAIANKATRGDNVADLAQIKSF